MPQGVTSVSREIYDIHMIVIWICVVIGVLVFGVMFYSMFAHRKSRGHKPATFHESTTVELVWTIIPAIILVVMAFPPPAPSRSSTTPAKPTSTSRSPAINGSGATTTWAPRWAS